ncbi:MAG: HAD-IG family 5'-nucleotidase [bacterium]|nr:HAD-IG family 5'-nucleotidase [bacterium]
MPRSHRKTDSVNKPGARLGKASPGRRIFCNRTLNLRSIRAIGYDMDYTLIHYRVEKWEQRSFSHMRRKLKALNWPVETLRFESRAFQRGLILDTELGNILKANQFGYIKSASHGTAMLDFETLRQIYAETVVDLAGPRFVFLNTLFSLSEANMFAQLVDLLDQGHAPEPMGYFDLHRLVKRVLDEAHMEGRLKADIVAHPERYVVPDPEIPWALLDQQRAGKRLLLITNSEWPFTRDMMSYAFDRFLPVGVTWRDLFSLIIVAARKPTFFMSEQPYFEVTSEEGLLTPVVGLPQPGSILYGGHAQSIERIFGLRGSQILYVGDHVYGDVQVSKNLHRWRTALVVREMEKEVRVKRTFASDQKQITDLMDEKRDLEFTLSLLRLRVLHRRMKQSPPKELSLNALQAEVRRIRNALLKLDEQITPLAQAVSELGNPNWGLLMASGNDKSYFARQVERHADIYTSRVSNLLYETPYAFFRADRAWMPHEREL